MDTFVICMACGRPFCRLCSSPRGAGHYCPACYGDSVTYLKEKFESVAADADTVGREVDREKTESISSTSHESRINLQTDYAFPIGFVEKDHFEETPEVMKYWKGLSIAVLTGALAWILICAVTHHRYWYVSVLIAAGVSLSVAYILGGRFDPTGALVATCIAILSLAIGDLVLQLLVARRLIGGIDVLIPKLTGIQPPGYDFKDYVFNLFVLRLIPSVAVAFLVAWWPFKKRLGWKGFEKQAGE